MCKNIVVCLLKASTVKAEKQPLLDNGPYTCSRRMRHVRCDVTQQQKRCYKRRSLWFRAALVGTQLCSAAVNQHATTEGAVFSVVTAPRLYNMDLAQLELELSRVPELAVAAENWESRQSSRIENNGKKGIRLCEDDFMCDLKLQCDCYESVARRRLVESVIDWGH
jgi:hypothetical protein